MNSLRPIVFRVFSQSLLLTALAFFGSSVFAQQIVYFQKPTALSGCQESDEIQKRILYEYGAVYLSKNAILPTRCRFENETEIAEFTNQFKTAENKFSFGEFYLQPNAKKSLDLVIARLDNNYKKVARNDNNSTTVTKGINDDWALRTYAQTEVNWLRKLNKEQILFSRSVLSIIQVNDEKKPVMFSVAIPGGSQHHLGLAIDVNSEGENKCGNECENALRENGWFRTVRFDSYHFTYLGYEESKLRDLGLKKVDCKNGVKYYWVPNVKKTVYSGYTNWRCEDVQ